MTFLLSAPDLLGLPFFDWLGGKSSLQSTDLIESMPPNKFFSPDETWVKPPIQNASPTFVITVKWQQESYHGNVI